MRPHQFRTSSEQRRKSSGNVSLDHINFDATRRRSINLAQNNAGLQDGSLRRLSLALNPQSDLKQVPEDQYQCAPSWRNIYGAGNSLSNFILRRKSLPPRIGFNARGERRISGLGINDHSKQDLNMHRIKLLIVCFIVALSLAMIILYLRSSNTWLK